MTYWDNEVLIKGVALNTRGLSAYDLTDNNQSTDTIQMLTIEGLSLNTSGMLWPLDGVWHDCSTPVTTTWTDCG